MIIQYIVENCSLFFPPYRYCALLLVLPQLDDEVETLVAVELLEAPVMRPNGRLLRSPEYNVLLGVKALHTLFA